MNEDHRALVDSIARHVVYDCASATACMSTNAVTFLLLTRYVIVECQCFARLARFRQFAVVRNDIQKVHQIC